jgi:hypothetical protein
VAKSSLAPEIARPVGRAAREVAKTLDSLGGAIEGFFAPRLTPEQKLAGQIESRRREAEAEQAIDFSQFTSEVAQARQDEERRAVLEQQQEQERER